MNTADLWIGRQLIDQIEMTDDIKWALIRQYRTSILTKCDWTQIPDAPLTLQEKQAWAAYRQLLRDLPESFVAPEDVVLPEPPDPTVINETGASLRGGEASQ